MRDILESKMANAGIQQSKFARLSDEDLFAYFCETFSLEAPLIQTMVDPVLPTDSTGSGFTTPVPTKMYQTPIYYFSKPVGTDTVNIKIDRIVLNTQQPRIVSSINDVIGPSIFMFEIVGIN